MSNLALLFNILTLIACGLVYADDIDYNRCRSLAFSERNKCLIELSKQQEHLSTDHDLMPTNYHSYFEFNNKSSAFLLSAGIDYGMILEGRNWSSEGQYFANRNYLSLKWLDHKGIELAVEYHFWSLKSTGVQIPSDAFWGRPGFYTLFPIFNNKNNLWRLGLSTRVPLISGNIGGASERFRVWRIGLNSDYKYRINKDWNFNLENSLFYESEYATTTTSGEDHIYQRPILLKVFPSFSYYYGLATYQIGYKHWFSLTETQHFSLSKNQTERDDPINFGGLETSARYTLSQNLWLNIGLGINLLHQEKAHLRTDTLAEDLNELSSIRTNLSIEKAF